MIETPLWAELKYGHIVEGIGITGAWRSRAYQLCHMAMRYGMESERWCRTFGNYAYDAQILELLQLAWDEFTQEGSNDAA